MNLDYNEITKEYSEDYFCEPMEKTLKFALQLIERVKNGEFEYDTSETDMLLWNLRSSVNEIDI